MKKLILLFFLGTFVNAKEFSSFERIEETDERWTYSGYWRYSTQGQYGSGGAYALGNASQSTFNSNNTLSNEGGAGSAYVDGNGP